MIATSGRRNCCSACSLSSLLALWNESVLLPSAMRADPSVGHTLERRAGPDAIQPFTDCRVEDVAATLALPLPSRVLHLMPHEQAFLRSAFRARPAVRQVLESRATSDALRRIPSARVVDVTAIAACREYHRHVFPEAAALLRGILDGDAS